MPGVRVSETNSNLLRIRHKVTTELSRYSRLIARYGNHTNDVIVIALHAHDLKLRAARYIRAQRTMKLVRQLIPVPKYSLLQARPRRPTWTDNRYEARTAAWPDTRHSSRGLQYAPECVFLLQRHASVYAQ